MSADMMASLWHLRLSEQVLPKIHAVFLKLPYLSRLKNCSGHADLYKFCINVIQMFRVSYNSKIADLQLIDCIYSVLFIYVIQMLLGQV